LAQQRIGWSNRINDGRRRNQSGGPARLNFFDNSIRHKAVTAGSALPKKRVTKKIVE
jgi:hypothetical protein